MYREYLDPALPRRLRRLAGQVQEPVQRPRRQPPPAQLGRRDAQRAAGGRRHRRRGGVPQHRPAVLPELRALRRPPSPTSTSTASPASGPTTAGSSTSAAAFPERRAGVGQIFLNDVDDAIADVRWIKEHGLRGGILLPNIAPDVKWVKPLYDRCYDPLWAGAARTSRCRSTAQRHRQPRLRRLPVLHAALHQRGALLHGAPAGAADPLRRVRALPATSSSSSPSRAAPGCPPLLERLDVIMGIRRDRGDSARSATATSTCCPRRRHRVLPPELLDGRQPAPAGRRRRPPRLGLDKFMWGSDYPHDEGTYPYTPENIRQAFHDCPRARLRQILAGNAAKLYGFDLDALAPLAAELGPTVAEVHTPPVPDRVVMERTARPRRRAGPRHPPHHPEPAREAQRPRPPAPGGAHRRPPGGRRRPARSGCRSSAAPAPASPPATTSGDTRRRRCPTTPPAATASGPAT